MCTQVCLPIHVNVEARCPHTSHVFLFSPLFLYLVFEATSLTKPTPDSPTMTPWDPPAFAHTAGITDVCCRA